MLATEPFEGKKSPILVQAHWYDDEDLRVDPQPKGNCLQRPGDSEDDNEGHLNKLSEVEVRGNAWRRGNHPGFLDS